MEYLNDLISVNTMQDLLRESRDCVLAISGGQDSMMLLHWFAKNRDQFSQRIRVVHVNHGISDQSDTWAEFVLHQCDQYGIPGISMKVSLDNLSNNLEYAARQARYQALCGQGADAICTAHHANDQIENFFLRVFRGSGVRGLKAMSVSSPCWWDSNVKLIRPMLNVTKSQIEQYIEQHEVSYVTDPSNANDQFDRNYVRNQIWPVVSHRFDIADINTLKSIQHLGEAWQLISELADQDLKATSNHDGTLNWPALKELGYLRIKNLILRLMDINEIYNIKIGHIEQFSRGLVTATSDSRNELNVRGFRMYKTGHVIFQETVQ